MAEFNNGRTRPVPSWIFPAGKYLYCGIAVLVIVLGVVLGGIG